LLQWGAPFLGLLVGLGGVACTEGGTVVVVRAPGAKVYSDARGGESATMIPFGGLVTVERRRMPWQDAASVRWRMVASPEKYVDARDTEPHPLPSRAMYVLRSHVAPLAEPSNSARNARSALKLGAPVEVMTYPGWPEGWVAVAEQSHPRGFVRSDDVGAEPPRADGAVARAASLVREGAVEEARAALEDALALEPAQADARAFLAALVATSDPKLAAEYARDLPPRPWPEVPTTPAVVGTGPAFVGVTVARLRQEPSPDARLVRNLPINTAVDVLEVRGDWARVRVTPPAGVALVVSLVGEDPPAPLVPQVEGHMALRLLAAAAQDGAALQEQARAAQAEGNWDRAFILAERALAVQPASLLAHGLLRDSALQGKRYVQALTPRPAAGVEAPGARAVSAEALLGCRGDLAAAETVSVPVADLSPTLDKVPPHACLAPPDALGPCPPTEALWECSEEEEPGSCESMAREFGALNDRKRTEHDRAMTRHAARLASIAARLPSGPVARFRAQSLSALAPGEGTLFLYGYDVTPAGECTRVSQAPRQTVLVKELGLDAAVKTPVDPVTLVVRVPGYANWVVGLLRAASHAAAEAAVRALPVPLIPDVGQEVARVETHGPLLECFPCEGY
jgi:tetratricopeptide (TPR) repeat protein